MTEEQAFLSAITANPDDHTAKLVYADWLQDHDDPRAEIMRLRVRVAALEEGGIEARERLIELEKTISPHWLAQLDGPVWCLAGNVLGSRPSGPGGTEISHGTRLFKSNAKVYLADISYWRALWWAPDVARGHRVGIVGRHCKSVDWIRCIVRADYVTNWRVELVYQPGALVRLKKEGWQGFQLPRGAFVCPEDKSSYKARRDLLAALGAPVPGVTRWAILIGKWAASATLVGYTISLASRPPAPVPSGPAAMLRAAALVVLLSVATALVAAPVPPPPEKDLIAKLFGKVEGQGEFELEGKQLTVRSTIGRPNRDFAWDQRPSAPRSKTLVKGDFEVTVRVLDATPPLKDAKNDPGTADVCAGLYVQGGASIFRYSLGQSYQRFPGAANPNLQRQFRIEASYPRGGAGGSLGAPENGKAAYLRLIRKGNEILMSHSADGEKWSAPNNPFKNIDMGFPDEVNVGVFLSHSTHQFAHATFDLFSVTKPK